MDIIEELLNDRILVQRIAHRLPFLFQIAEMESSRADKVGMQVGSLRENILIALLIYKFGEHNMDFQVPITESQTDVFLFNNPISIKTITGNRLKGVKLIWTVDPIKAKDFINIYSPTCDLLLVQINWESIGGLYYKKKRYKKRYSFC